MKLELCKKRNHLIIIFNDEEEFNEDILTQITDGFYALDNKKPLYVILYNEIPIVAGVYIFNVSNYCEMTLEHEDENIEEFIKMVPNHKIKKIIKRKKNG